MTSMHRQSLLLVADDDPDDQYFFQEAIEMISSEGTELHFAFDGAQLLRFLQRTALEQYQRNLIVLDLNMQVKDGQTTLREIKANPAYADIPVVILTTSGNPEDLRYCREHGAAACYQKPRSVVELLDIVRGMYREYLAA